MVGFQLILVGLALQKFPTDSGWQVWSAGCGLSLIMLSITVSVWGLRPRTLDGVDLSAFQAAWQQTLQSTPSVDPAGQFAEHLLRGHPESKESGTNPISSLAQAAAARARCNIGSLMLAAAGAVLLVVSQIPSGGTT